MSSKEVLVSILLDGQNLSVGKLWFTVRGQKESASFKYNPSWLEHPKAFALEPALPLTEAVYHTEQGKSLFGSLGDSAPDRWGRVLMRRGELAQAQKENRTPKTLFEIDYLLGVNDEARQGALRFSRAPHTDLFLSAEKQISIPPLLALPKLLSATERFIADNESTEDLQLLLAPGSSLGGARPKASIKEKDGTLAIAKFPKKDDAYNVVVWEAICLTLAKKAGIQTPNFRVETVAEKSVLIISRFDRNGTERIPFLSAMSMLGARDNEQHSYLEIAYALTQHSAYPEEELHKLWRRIVFTIMVSNTDDHLRNHGFLHKNNKGWQLSPVYDINPTPLEMGPHVLTTAIDFNDTNASLETALRVIQEFRLTEQEAKKIITEVALAVQEWRSVAHAYGLSKKECDMMSSAFTNYSGS